MGAFKSRSWPLTYIIIKVLGLDIHHNQGFGFGYIYDFSHHWIIVKRRSCDSLNMRTNYCKLTYHQLDGTPWHEVHEVGHEVGHKVKNLFNRLLHYVPSNQ